MKKFLLVFAVISVLNPLSVLAAQFDNHEYKDSSSMIRCKEWALKEVAKTDLQNKAAESAGTSSAARASQAQ